MSTTRTSTRTIETIETLRPSRNGNPRFLLHFTDGSQAMTQSDSGYAYETGNHGHREGDTIEITWTRAGRIAYAKPTTNPKD